MKFSVIIPTCDRVKSLLITLSCFEKMKFKSSEYEIIVVDNSTNNLLEKNLTKIQKKMSNLRFTREEKQGPSFARNHGANLAKYSHLIFCDDDCLLPQDFLSLYEKMWLENPDAKIIGGKVVVKKADGELSDFEKMIIDHHGWCLGSLEYGLSRQLNIDFEESLSSANLSYKKDSNELIFDTRLGRVVNNTFLLGAEDFELSLRILLFKKKVLFCNEICVVNTISSQRFSDHYLRKRYWVNGIEQYIMDTILESRFPDYFNKKGRFQKVIKRFFLTPPYSLFFFTYQYRLLTLFSYFFNGKYFTQ